MNLVFYTLVRRVFFFSRCLVLVWTSLVSFRVTFSKLHGAVYVSRALWTTVYYHANDVSVQVNGFKNYYMEKLALLITYLNPYKTSPFSCTEPLSCGSVAHRARQLWQRQRQHHAQPLWFKMNKWIIYLKQRVFV